MIRKSRSAQMRHLALLLCLTWALAAAGCRTPVDLDGIPAGAVNLSLDRWHGDRLDCKRGDCADWYRVVLSQRGYLSVEMSAPSLDSQVRHVILTLSDEHARSIAETGSSEPTLAVDSLLEPGIFLVSVKTHAKPRNALGYDIVANFTKWEPPPPPPPLPPQFRALESEVLEHERRPGEPESVLLSRGSHDGIIKDLYGRLLNGDEEIARIQVVDVYPDGSRARLLEALQGVITPSTHAEIDIPIPGPGFASPDRAPVSAPFGGSTFEATPRIEPESHPTSTLPWQTDPGDALPPQMDPRGVSPSAQDARNAIPSAQDARSTVPTVQDPRNAVPSVPDPRTSIPDPRNAIPWHN